MAKKTVIRQSKLLLVEGKDEEYFFDALIKYLEINNIQVLSFEGKSNLKNKLNVVKYAHSFEDVTAIGIVRDADGNPKGAFDSVCSALQSANLPKPTEPLSSSTETPRIMVMVMPPSNVGTNRMLEDLCLEAVKDDPATACVNDYFACLQEQNISQENNVIAKAHLHAFLASRERPDLRLGEAAQKDYWPWENPAFDPVKAFIQQIASE